MAAMRGLDNLARKQILDEGLLAGPGCSFGIGIVPEPAVGIRKPRIRTGRSVGRRLAEEVELFPDIHKIRPESSLNLRPAPTGGDSSNILWILRRNLFYALLLALLIVSRLAHSGALWEGEVLPLAAALQMKRGAVLYRDIWFDKPPLVPAIYLLWGAAIGPVGRVAGAIYASIVCLLGGAVAERLWGRREQYIASALFAFFLIFDIHSGVLPLAADLLLLAPHLAAILLAIQKRPLLSGLAAGIGLLFNTKAVFVLAACAIFAWPQAAALLAGFAIPNLLAVAWMWHSGALEPWLDQAWRWPALYAGSPVVANPIANGVVRTLNWLGFHAALVVGAVLAWRRDRNWKFLLWTGLAYAGVVLGWRFFPRYFFLLLPALAIPAARGLANLRSKALIALVGISLAVPAIRFTPRYLSIQGWNDLAMDRDSQEAARLALRYARPGSTLYVWGYRPEIFVYTGLKPATRYLDSQALTGVPADRHLTQSTVVLTKGTRDARAELAQSSADIVIDGLSRYNPELAMDRYPELSAWLAGYHPVASTPTATIYARN